MDWLARHAPQRRAVALLEDEHDDPERRGEREQVQQHGLERQDERAERPGEQDQGQQHDQGDGVGEAAGQRVQEVTVGRGDAGESAVRSP